jgi:hypothetical protein
VPTDDEVNAYAAEMREKGEQREAELIGAALGERNSRVSEPLTGGTPPTGASLTE